MRSVNSEKTSHSAVRTPADTRTHSFSGLGGQFLMSESSGAAFPCYCRLLIIIHDTFVGAVIDKLPQIRGKQALGEDGFDSLTSGLWGQHVSAVPLCRPSLQIELYLYSIIPFRKPATVDCCCLHPHKYAHMQFKSIETSNKLAYKLTK